MGELAIQVEGLSKQFRIGTRRQNSYQTLRGALVEGVAAPFRRANKLLHGQASGAAGLDQTIWALKDLTFDIEHGEVVGIVGHNGAGKSTLLKILSRITEPTEGRARLYGRVGSLLEVGTGFHPELTGRENVFLNGAILGMNRAEIASKFDEIVDFAEVEQFIDTPVKHYSSGMYLRLAFSVAAHLEPEILMVDEVLAVGDAAFQRKCLGKMGDVAQTGRTVLLVSHNMASIAKLCNRTMLIDHGHLTMFGDTSTVINTYIASRLANNPTVDLSQRHDRTGLGTARVQGITMESEGFQTDTVQGGSPVTFRFDYQGAAGEPLSNILFELKVFDQADQLLFTLSSFLTGDVFESLPPQGSVYCHVPAMLLAPGTYTTTVICYVNRDLCDLVHDASRFTVVAGNYLGGGKEIRQSWYGYFLMPQRWYVDRPEPAVETTGSL